jgi:hypothetical protein
MAALLSSFLKDFRQSFLTTHILLALVQKVQKSYLYLKMPNENCSSTDVDFLLVAAL